MHIKSYTYNGAMIIKTLFSSTIVTFRMSFYFLLFEPT